MKKTFAILFITSILVALSIVGCKLLDRLNSGGNWTCTNHGHVVADIDYDPEVERYTSRYGCQGWTYTEEELDDAEDS